MEFQSTSKSGVTTLISELKIFIKKYLHIDPTPSHIHTQNHDETCDYANVSGLNFALIKEGREGGKENSSLEKQTHGIMGINSFQSKRSTQINAVTTGSLNLICFVLL